jgi:hypothetical protein
MAALPNPRTAFFEENPMYADLIDARNELQSANAPRALAAARRRLGRYTRKVIDRVTAPGVGVPEAVRRLLRGGAGAAPDDARAPAAALAVNAVLVHAAFDLWRRALRPPPGPAGRAYDLYFREDQPDDLPGPPATLAEALAQAVGEGDAAVADLVAARAGARLGLRGPTPGLVRAARRRLAVFYLIGYEARRLPPEGEPTRPPFAARAPVAAGRHGPPADEDTPAAVVRHVRGFPPVPASTPAAAGPGDPARPEGEGRS